MKKAAALVLVLALLFSCASAQAVAVGGGVENPDALSLSLDKAYVAETWRGEESSTHDWIVLEVTIANFATEALSLDEQLSASLVYGGKYAFEAERIFELAELGPLVRVSGALVFKVPKMVAEAEPAELDVTLALNGDSHPVALDYRAAAVSEIGIPDAYFESPEEAIAYFAECVKNQNLLGALGATCARPAAVNFDLAAAVERVGTYMPAATTDMWLPSEYEAYVPFNTLTALETRRLFNFVTALLAGGRPLTGTTLAQLDSSTGAFKEDGSALSGLTAEQMIDMLDPARLSGLELREVCRYEGGAALTENYQKGTLANGMVYGFGGCRDYLAIYELDGQRYAHTCMIVRYPQGWKIFRLFSYLLGADFPSEVVRAEEFGANLAEPDWVLTWKNGAADPAKALKMVDTAQLVGRWKAPTEETAEFLEFIEFREDGSCQGSEGGEILEGVWNANSLCIAMGESIRALRGYLYALEGDRLTLIHDSERYVFEGA
ncbi:MAG: hypothetical protein GX592_08045 [Clostridiales bacterium]|nr:hypothetical protein [Clostridiales bacterium]